MCCAARPRAWCARGFEACCWRISPCAGSCTRRRCGPTRIRTGCRSCMPCAWCATSCRCLRVFPRRDRLARHNEVLDEILEERVASSRGRQVPRGVKRNMSCYQLRPRKPEQQQVVAHAVPPGLGRVEQLGHPGWGLVVLGAFVPISGVGDGIRATSYLSPFGRGRLHTRDPLLVGHTAYHAFGKMRLCKSRPCSGGLCDRRATHDPRWPKRTVSQSLDLLPADWRSLRANRIESGPSKHVAMLKTSPEDFKVGRAPLAPSWTARPRPPARRPHVLWLAAGPSGSSPAEKEDGCPAARWQLSVTQWQANALGRTAARKGRIVGGGRAKTGLQQGIIKRHKTLTT